MLCIYLSLIWESKKIKIILYQNIINFIEYIMNGGVINNQNDK